MTTTTSVVPAPQPAEAALIKTDVLGRRRYPRAQREQLLEEYDRSGLSGPKFAALCGVSYQTFATWLQGRKRPRPVARPVQWLEAAVQPTAAAPAPGLLLHLPGGMRAEITTAQHLPLAVALVRALERPC